MSVVSATGSAASDPSRQKMLTRLAAMDLKRVFDLDGSGFIDPIVLARSLKLWDSAVFTDDAISDFYKWSGIAKVEADGSGSGSKGNGIIAIQDLARFVKNQCPKLPRIKRRSSSRGGDSVVSAASGAGSEASSFSAAPRSFRTREPSASAASSSTRTKGGSRSKSGTRKSRGTRSEEGGAADASEAAMVKELAAKLGATSGWSRSSEEVQPSSSASKGAASKELTGLPDLSASAKQSLEEGLVNFTIVVPGIDFHALAKDETLLGQFEDCAKDAISAEAEVPPENIILEFSAGSVIINATIVPPEGCDVDSLRQKIASSNAMSDRVVSSVTALEGIASLVASKTDEASGSKAAEFDAAAGRPLAAEPTAAEGRPETAEGGVTEEPENEPDSEPVPALPSTAEATAAEPQESKSAFPEDGTPALQGRPQLSPSSLQRRARETMLKAEDKGRLQPALSGMRAAAWAAERPSEDEVKAAAAELDKTVATTVRKLQAPPPPSAELIRRLASLNLLRVLDIDGSGLIERDVLKCSLQIFDAKVFTDEACESLIHAATRGRGMDDGKEIRILDLALFMGAPVLYPVTPIPEVGDDGEEEDDQKSIMESVPATPFSMSQGGRFGTAENMLALAVGSLEEDEWSRMSGVLHTARTEIESVVADLQTMRVALPELQGGASGCIIRRAEMRGITLRQLKCVMNYVEEHCERESWYDPETEELLTPELVDMHCLTEWVLKPATRDRRCSFVEAIAPRPSAQSPTWYVSHCAGPVKDFVQCLMEHAMRHHFGDDVCYWVDAYANNHWERDDSAGMWEKALSKTAGTVQVIGHGPVAYVEVGAHSKEDGDADPFHGVRCLSPKLDAATAAARDLYN